MGPGVNFAPPQQGHGHGHCNLRHRSHTLPSLGGVAGGTAARVRISLACTHQCVAYCAQPVIVLHHIHACIRQHRLSSTAAPSDLRVYSWCPYIIPEKPMPHPSPPMLRRRHARTNQLSSAGTDFCLNPCRGNYVDRVPKETTQVGRCAERGTESVLDRYE